MEMFSGLIIDVERLLKIKPPPPKPEIIKPEAKPGRSGKKPQA
jgi:hypothetical protein